MRALMAPCLVIYGEACHYFRIYYQQDIENASSGSFTSQLLIWNFMANKKCSISAFPHHPINADDRVRLVLQN